MITDSFPMFQQMDGSMNMHTWIVIALTGLSTLLKKNKMCSWGKCEELQRNCEMIYFILYINEILKSGEENKLV